MLLAPLWVFVAFTPLIAANLLQTASLVLLPVSRPLFHRVNMVIATAVWSWWRVIVEKIHGTRLVVMGDALPPGESAVVFANHQSMADIVVLLNMALPMGRVTDMRWMVKASMRFVPFLGWAMLSLDFLFVKRDWSKDRARILGTFERLRGKAEPVWLVLFPEGTRKTPEKHAASMRQAAKLGYPATKRVMLPRPKGFAAALQGLSGKVQAVYGITVVYPGEAAPTLVQLFSGAVPEIRLIVKRYPIAELPTDAAEVARWLTAEFQEMNAELMR